MKIYHVTVSPGDFITVQLDRTPTEHGLNLESFDAVDAGAVTMDGNSFHAPIEKGTYILMYYANWDDNGSGTNGDSSYVFKVEVK